MCSDEKEVTGCVKGRLNSLGLCPDHLLPLTDLYVCLIHHNRGP